ncbi:hypothetical protein [Brucella intermedia]|uniref:Uncharacterized protein n=1 Tax=Brucella intermedia M86 TaxID=1234597 RepID=M5JTP8_9HYPH|nr:hypothetical protein [Brucella intermedia]ELT47404.1 hypothetical protein D584_19928 [Brucella intermedia M86]
MTDEERVNQAMEIANEIEGLLDGKDIRAGLTAIAMVLGAASARMPSLNFESLMREIYQSAKVTFDEFERDIGHA